LTVEQRKQALQGDVNRKKSERDALQQQLKKANTDSANLKKRLASFKAPNTAQEAALADLKGRQARLQADIQASQASSGPEDARQAEAERLRREVERLAKDTETLSAL